MAQCKTSPEVGGMGHSVNRKEDPRFIRGQGNYVDDIVRPGMVFMDIVRSPYAHAKIKSINTEKALAHPGVAAVFTLDDFRPHIALERLPLQFPSKAFRSDVTPWLLSGKEVSHVGEVVAMVIAVTRYIAEDAAVLVDVEYETLPSVAGSASAFAVGAPSVHRDHENLLCSFEQSYGDVGAAFASAPHVFRESFVQHRGAAHPIEGRGAVARYDALDDGITVWSSTQMSHELRSAIV